VRGIDPSPVRPLGEAPPKLAAEHVFEEDTNAVPVLEAALYGLVEKAGEALRRRRLAARGVGVVLEHTDGVRSARRAGVRPATANDRALFPIARRLLEAAGSRRVRVRRLRFVCDRLIHPPAQLELFAADREAPVRQEALIAAIDRVRSRFGPDALRVGRTLAA